MMESRGTSMVDAKPQTSVLSESLVHLPDQDLALADLRSVKGLIGERNEQRRILTSLRVIFSQTRLNSRPSTKLGRVIRRRPNMRIGTVIRRPRKERGVISPYPTVVIAIGRLISMARRIDRKGVLTNQYKPDVKVRCERVKRWGFKRTNQAAAGMDYKDRSVHRRR